MYTAAGSAPAGYMWPTATLASQPVIPLYEAKVLYTLKRMGTILVIVLPIITAFTAYVFWDNARQQSRDGGGSGGGGLLSRVQQQAAEVAAASDATVAAKQSGTIVSSARGVGAPLPQAQMQRPLLYVNLGVAALTVATLLFNRRLIRSMRLYPRSRLVGISTLHTLPYWRLFGGVPREVLIPLEALSLPPLASSSPSSLMVRLQVAEAPRVESVLQWQLPDAQSASTTNVKVAANASSSAAAPPPRFDDAWSAVIADLARGGDSSSNAVAESTSSSSTSQLSLRPAQTFYLFLANGVLSYSGSVASGATSSAEPALAAMWNRMLSTSLHSQPDVEQLTQACNKTV
jgi:hypothetical protein